MMTRCIETLRDYRSSSRKEKSIIRSQNLRLGEGMLRVINIQAVASL